MPCLVSFRFVSSHQKEFIGSSVVKDDRSVRSTVVNLSLGRQFDSDPTVSPSGHGADPGFVGSPRDKHFAVLPQIGRHVAEGDGRWLCLCMRI